MICIPVVAARQSEALRIIERAAGLADILELRMDLLADGKVAELIAAARSAAPDLKVLVTNRAVRAADFRDEKRRVGVLLEAVDQGADFVDIELATAAAWREEMLAAIAARQNRTALIVSHHDFRQTPSPLTLRSYFKKSVQAGAGVVKIVTTARKPEDNLAVLGLIPYAGERKVRIVAFCMGGLGRISRVMAPLMGALFTFAALEEGAESADGQLTVGEMKEVLNILKPSPVLKK